MGGLFTRIILHPPMTFSTAYGPPPTAYRSLATALVVETAGNRTNNVSVSAIDCFGLFFPVILLRLVIIIGGQVAKSFPA
jgi:hypothetical protein